MLKGCQPFEGSDDDNYYQSHVTREKDTWKTSNFPQTSWPISDARWDLNPLLRTEGAPLLIALIYCFPTLEREWNERDECPASAINASKLTSPSSWFLLKPQEFLEYLHCFFFFSPLEFCNNKDDDDDDNDGSCCYYCLCRDSLVEIQRSMIWKDFFHPRSQRLAIH